MQTFSDGKASQGQECSATRAWEASPAGWEQGTHYRHSQTIEPVVKVKIEVLAHLEDAYGALRLGTG